MRSMLCLLSHARISPAALLLGGAFLLLGWAAGPSDAAAQDAFITTWETTTANDTITIPTAASDTTYDFTIDWGDGTTETYSGTDPDPSHVYATADTHTVTITGTFPRIFLNGLSFTNGDVANADKLESIDQWGTISWQSMRYAFAGADSLTYTASDTPDLSDVSDMEAMFRGASSFNGAIGDWNVSSVTDMSRLFQDASAFKQPIRAWDVSGVTTMYFLLGGASSFNQPIGGWDVSGVTDMAQMFSDATSFNQPLDAWNVSNVTDMSRMFQGTSSFNQPIGSWSVANVTDMFAMFEDASSFNQDLGSWDVANVDSDDFSSFPNAFERFLDRSGLSPDNYDALLNGWSQLNLTDSLSFGAREIQYTQAGAEARQSIIDSFGWTIKDGGQLLSVTSIRPESGAPGTQVRIYGAGFDSTASGNVVTVGAAQATVDSISANAKVLYAQVPNGPSGPVDVSVSDGDTTVVASDRFDVLTQGSASFAKAGVGLADITGPSDAADFDGDGDRDLAVIGTDTSRIATATIYRNEGDGTFTAVGAGLTGVTGGDVSWGDYNQDGRPDLVITGSTSDGSPSTTVYRNDGNGQFTAIDANIMGFENRGVSIWGDYDSDGDLDLFVHGRRGPGNNSAELYRNGGDDTFTPIQVNITGREFGPSADWGDYNNDGRLDLAVSGANGGPEIPAVLYRNEGDGTFTEVSPGLEGGSGSTIRWGDYDSDGRLDLVLVCDTNGPVSGGDFAAIYQNQGGERFSPIDAGITGVRGKTEWGDVDSDGRLDLVVSGDSTAGSPGGAATKLYRNEGGDSFSEIGTQLNSFRGAPTWIDREGDGDLDLLVPGRDNDGNPRTILYGNGVDTTAPALSTRPSGGPSAPGTDAEIQVDVPSGFAPTQGSLFYRRAGARSFQSSGISVNGLPSTTDTTLRATVPGAAVDTLGAQYYVELRQSPADDTLRATAPPQAPDRFGTIQTRVDQVAAAGAFQNETYRMLTVPLDLGDRSVRDVLAEQYGEADPSSWRLLRWSPADSSYREDDQLQASLTSGQAAWLITAEGRPLSVQNAQSVPAGAPDTLRLRPGWNQIGSPFPFPVAWSDVEGTDAVREIVAYDGTRPSGERYQFDASVLRPWRGYFAFNDTDGEASLLIPPQPADTTGQSSAQTTRQATANESEGYRLQAITRVSREERAPLFDRQAWMGLESGAAAQVGPEDMPKPPSVGPHVHAAVMPSEGPALAQSLKPHSGDREGAYWDVRLSLQSEAPYATERPATVRLKEYGPRPDGFQRYVLDQDRGRRLPLMNGTVRVEGLRDDAPRHLRVIVGTEAFARDNSGDATLDIQETRLRANAPNPFRRSTTISYQLAEPGHVTIRVYDTLGRRVATLVDGHRQAGVHQYVWTAQGWASGVYFCRMQAGDDRDTRRMVIAR